MTRQQKKLAEAVAMAQAGNADRLHDLLKREKSHLGRAYLEISDVLDSLEASPANDPVIGSLGFAMAEIRGIMIKLLLIHKPSITPSGKGTPTCRSKH